MKKSLLISATIIMLSLSNKGMAEKRDPLFDAPRGAKAPLKTNPQKQKASRHSRQGGRHAQQPINYALIYDRLTPAQKQELFASIPSSKRAQLLKNQKTPAGRAALGQLFVQLFGQTSRQTTVDPRLSPIASSSLEFSQPNHIELNGIHARVESVERDMEQLYTVAAMLAEGGVDTNIIEALCNEVLDLRQVVDMRDAEMRELHTLFSSLIDEMTVMQQSPLIGALVD